MREMLQAFFISDRIPHHERLSKVCILLYFACKLSLSQWLDPAGFRSLLALLGTNATGVGCRSAAR
jgi:hypothetical protein